MQLQQPSEHSLPPLMYSWVQQTVAGFLPLRCNREYTNKQEDKNSLCELVSKISKSTLANTEIINNP